MTTNNPTAARPTNVPTAQHNPQPQPAQAPRPPVRHGDETKASFKTTELIAYVVAVAGVLVASYLVQTTDAHEDYFRADRAWFYVVLLTVGYMVSRGLAKSGSRHNDDH
ncbi:MAG: hypothetical protein QOK02_5801 [Mycobacterium sp.]|jgi:hypothetical protein|nr:hypothetical protein [Mycobacterium sp.]